MTLFCRWSRLVALSGCGLFLLSSAVWAQDPFGNKMLAAPAAPAGGKDEGAESAVLRGDHLVILAIRDSKPTTAAELLRAAEATLDFERPDESKRYLTILLEKKPAATELVKAHRQIGSALLIRFNNEAQLQPEGAQTAKLVLDAAYAAARDKKRVDSLVKQASDPDPLKRELARLDLAEVGIDAAEPLLAVISQASREREHRYAQAALIALKDELSPMIIAALDAKKPLLREKALEVVREINSREALYLVLRRSLEPGSEGELAREIVQRQVGSQPTRVEIETVLERKVEELIQQEWLEKTDLAGLVTVWYWKQDTDVLASRTLTPQDVNRLKAARLAADLSAIAPENARYRRLALLTHLEWRAVDSLATTELDLPAWNADEFVTALEDAVKRQRPIAVIGILQALAKHGDESLLRTTDGRESLVGSLLRHTDRRVRLEACRTIVSWKPKTSFPGASHLTDSLGYFLSSTGTPKVLIADVREDHAQTLVGLLAQAGYEADAVYSSKQFMQQATLHADYEFAILSDAIDQPRALEMISWLRRDYRTKEMLVVVTGREGYRTALERKLREEPQVMVMPRLHPDTLVNNVADDATPAERKKAEREQTDRVLPVRSVPGAQIRSISKELGRGFLSAPGRYAQTLIAVDLLQTILADANSPLRADVGRLEPILVEAAGNESISAKISPFLAELGTPKAQTVLVDLASRSSFPLAERQAAAAAFGRAIAKRGILLTKDQIVRQYDRYNRSETADAGTQQVLASILDAMEAKQKKSAP